MYNSAGNSASVPSSMALSMQVLARDKKLIGRQVLKFNDRHQRKVYSLGYSAKSYQPIITWIQIDITFVHS